MKKFVDWRCLEEKPYKPLAKPARKVAADGCVLLKNEGHILPLKKEDKISLFGRTQIDYNKSGNGSGGLVNVEYVVNILDGIAANDKLTYDEELAAKYTEWLKDNPHDDGASWETAPWCQKEMPLDDETVKAAREQSDVAVIVIGRTSGEARDNSADKGSWYLSDDEEAMLETVSRYFEKTVVLLNVGNIIDMKWVEKYNIKSVMYIWQGGQEGGNAVADILCGDVTPSGKLTDTIARDISLYPGVKNFGDEFCNIYTEDIYVGYRYFETFAKNDVLYPFGFGLSYTEFERKIHSVSEENGKITIDINVKNNGQFSGREIVQVYFEAPQGLLGKSVRELCAFAKTGTLEPQAEEILHLEFEIENMAAYDDSGITGDKSCYVLEKGDYNIYVGSCVRCAEKVYTHTVEETEAVRKCSEALAPSQKFEIMYPSVRNGRFEPAYRGVSQRTVDYDKRIKSEMPREIIPTGDRGIKLIDVKNEKNTLEEFTAQLSDFDLMCILQGEGMCSPKVRAGSAGAIGGVTESLQKFGIPIIAVHDGPSGIRMDSGEKATGLPSGTAIACTWDTEIAQELYENTSVELCTHNIDSLLGPGINIHRVPLNGRNFEYFSEDPFLTGKMAAALVRGMSVYGNSATVKHFAANSQEFSRSKVDAAMSERAAREIYLKGFEYAVKEGGATSIMTSYNPINGIWTANNYELNTTILRNEWGYKGFVMTDWWPTLSNEKSDIKNLKNLVEAQNDVYMLTADVLTFKNNLAQCLENGEITRAQLQRNAMNILRYIADSHSLERFEMFGGNNQKSLLDNMDNLKCVACVTLPKSGEETEVFVPHSGKCLLCIDYSSDTLELNQMVISVIINDLSAASITVNGNGGASTVVYRDVTVAHDVNATSGETKIKVIYPDETITVNKIELKMVMNDIYIELI